VFCKWQQWTVEQVGDGVVSPPGGEFSLAAWPTKNFVWSVGEGSWGIEPKIIWGCMVIWAQLSSKLAQYPTTLTDRQSKKLG